MSVQNTDAYAFPIFFLFNLTTVRNELHTLANALHGLDWSLPRYGDARLLSLLSILTSITNAVLSDNRVLPNREAEALRFWGCHVLVIPKVFSKIKLTHFELHGSPAQMTGAVRPTILLKADYQPENPKPCPRLRLWAAPLFDFQADRLSK